MVRWRAPATGARKARRSAAVEQARASLWLLPSLFVVTAAVAALLLNEVEVGDSSPWRRVAFPGGADSARAILQAIAGSVITLAGVVFSLTVVTLQLASSQFSPRLLRTFLREARNQAVLGTFLATFTYALLALRGIRSGDTPEEDVVPALAVTGAYVLTAGSVVALVYFIDHIARSIRIDSLMREANEDTTKVIDDLFGQQDGAVISPHAMPEHPRWAAPVRATRSGFVQAVDDHKLLDAAVDAGAVVRVDPRIGDQVVAGAPLAWVWRPGRPSEIDDDLATAVVRGIRIGYERTLQQDVAYGLRQLVDIAVRAMSPGVNDPTTAVHAIGHLAALLVLLARRRVGPRVRMDADGVLRVVVPAMDLPGYLELACGQIRRYGEREPTVIVALLHMLREVARLDLPPPHAAAVERQAAMLLAAAERSTVDRRDLAPVRSAHREVVDLLGEHHQA